MKKSLLRCDICGGDLSILEDGSFAQCDFCGAKYTVERLQRKLDNLKTNESINVDGINTKERLLNNAETYFSFGKYDSALTVYEEIIKNYPDDYLGWWGKYKTIILINSDPDDFGKSFKSDMNSLKSLWPKMDDLLAPVKMIIGNNHFNTIYTSFWSKQPFAGISKPELQPFARINAQDVLVYYNQYIESRAGIKFTKKGRVQAKLQMHRKLIEPFQQSVADIDRSRAITDRIAINDIYYLNENIICCKHLNTFGDIFKFTAYRMKWGVNDLDSFKRWLSTLTV